MSSYDDAREALYDAIKVTTEQVMTSASATTRAKGLETLALAFRYTAGGAQPGSVSVEK